MPPIKKSPSQSSSRSKTKPAARPRVTSKPNGREKKKRTDSLSADIDSNLSTGEKKLFPNGMDDKEPLVEEEDLNDVVLEDPLEILEDPTLAVELSEDPVRLYLKEIGQINLLDAECEFRLAARIESERVLTLLEKHVEIPKGQPGHWQAVYQAAADQMVTNWQRFLEDTARLKQGDPPDIGLIVTEAQMLHLQWQNDQPSYMRSYLDNGVWGIFPVLVPLLLAGIRITTAAFSGDVGEGLQGWFLLAVAFDAIYLGAALFLFPFVYKDAE